MTSETLLKFYDQARKEHILLAFSGVFTQEIMVEYGKLLNDEADLSDNTRLILFSVYVELTQNILRYSSERSPLGDGSRGVGIVMVSEDENNYIVSSGNCITEDQADFLRTQIEALNRMDDSELKALKKKRRREEKPAGVLGVGLGLIEVAHRSVNPLEADFQPMDGDRWFYTVNASISK